MAVAANVMTRLAPSQASSTTLAPSKALSMTSTLGETCVVAAPLNWPFCNGMSGSRVDKSARQLRSLSFCEVPLVIEFQRLMFSDIVGSDVDDTRWEGMACQRRPADASSAFTTLATDLLQFARELDEEAVWSSVFIAWRGSLKATSTKAGLNKQRRSPAATGQLYIPLQSRYSAGSVVPSEMTGNSMTGCRIKSSRCVSFSDFPETIEIHRLMYAEIVGSDSDYTRWEGMACERRPVDGSSALASLAIDMDQFAYDIYEEASWSAAICAWKCFVDSSRAAKISSRENRRRPYVPPQLRCAAGNNIPFGRYGGGAFVAASGKLRSVSFDDSPEIFAFERLMYAEIVGSDYDDTRWEGMACQRRQLGGVSSFAIDLEQLANEIHEEAIWRSVFYCWQCLKIENCDNVKVRSNRRSSCHQRSAKLTDGLRSVAFNDTPEHIAFSRLMYAEIVGCDADDTRWESMASQRRPADGSGALTTLALDLAQLACELDVEAVWLSVLVAWQRLVSTSSRTLANSNTNAMPACCRPYVPPHRRYNTDNVCGTMLKRSAGSFQRCIPHHLPGVGQPRIGIDIGGVLTRDGEPDFDRWSEWDLTSEAPGAFQACKEVVTLFGADNVFLVSKVRAGGPMQQRTERWLHDTVNFCERTAVKREHIIFVSSVSGQDGKGVAASCLGLSFFVDDKLAALQSVFCDPFGNSGPLVQHHEGKLFHFAKGGCGRHSPQQNLEALPPNMRRHYCPVANWFEVMEHLRRNI